MKSFSVSTFIILHFLTISTWAADRSYGIAGDMGRFNSNSKSVRDSMLRLQTRHLIMPGDNLYKLKEGYKAVWSPWVDAGFLFSAVAIGNHNLSYKDEIDFFKLSAEFYSKVDKENDIRFIVLNSDNEHTVEAQMKFLKNELATSKNKFNFIMYHHPTFTVSNVHYWQEKEKFQRAIRGIVKAHADKLTALIWGHDHIASAYDFEGVPVLLSGSTHDPRTGDVSPQDHMGFEFERKWLAPQGKPYWLKMDALNGSEKSFILKFIRAEDDRVMCTMKLGARKSIEYLPDCQIQK